MKPHQIAGLIVCLLLTAQSAAAQEKGQNGIAMGFPAAIAFVWHPSENLGLRPEVTFSKSSSDNDGSAFSVSSDSWNFGVGISALFYFHGSDHLRPYFSPRFSYGHTSSTIDTSSGTVSSDASADTYTAAGSFGVQYGISRRFSVFGETGLTYSHLSQDSSTGSNASGDSIANRSAVGVILYFK